MLTQSSLTVALAGLTIAGVAHAGVVTYTATGHNNKDNFGGNILDLSGGESSGMNFNGSPNDPSMWEANSTNFGNEWQAQDNLGAATPSEDFQPDGVTPLGDGVAPTNNKVGWVIFDLGSALNDLDKMYIWNLREREDRSVEDYNILYALSPTVTPAASRTDNAGNDYDFSSGGWTQLGSTQTLPYRTNAGTDPDKANAVIDLSSIGSAQFLAIEILSADDPNGNGFNDRVGLAEVAITQIPEPGSLALLALGGLLIARRRRG